MNMRYHHDYPYFGWNRFTVFEHYRPMIGQIIMGPNFSFIYKGPIKVQEGSQKPGEKRSPSTLPLQASASEMKAAEIKSQIKWKSQK
jgi:hypothetical protein